MKKINVISILLATLLFLSPMLVNANTQLKIGVVNVRDIMQQSPQGEAITKTLEKEFGSRKNSIVSAQKSLQEKSGKYQRDSAVMSEAERKKTEKELVEKQRDIQRMEQEFREDGQARQNEEAEKLLKKINEVISRVAASEGYDMILHREAAPFASDKVDITAKVLAELKKSS